MKPDAELDTRTPPPRPRVPLERVLKVLLGLHDGIRDAVVSACERQSVERLSEVTDGSHVADIDTDIQARGLGDTVYAIDRVSEAELIDGLTDELASEQPVVLIAEGLPGGSMVLPRGAAARDAAWRILVDPIDGTRGLMYQKRAAWVLTGVAPNFGPGTTLRDIRLAVQTEIPLLKQHLCDQLHVLDRADDTGRIQPGEVVATRHNRLDGTTESWTPTPSRAGDIRHGFASMVRFFHGFRTPMSRLDEALHDRLLGRTRADRAESFEDQYMSTGGQLYELATGRDRMVADLRPLAALDLARRGLPMGLCCHPYDLASMLIAERLGVVLEGPDGRPLDARFSTVERVAWIGYANRLLADRVGSAIRDVLDAEGLLPRTPTDLPRDPTTP